MDEMASRLAGSASEFEAVYKMVEECLIFGDEAADKAYWDAQITATVLINEYNATEEIVWDAFRECCYDNGFGSFV
jgi:hypothetical protein